MGDNFSSFSFPDAFSHESCPARTRDVPRALMEHLGAILMTGGGHGHPRTAALSSKLQDQAQAQPLSQEEKQFREKRPRSVLPTHLDRLSFLY